MSNTAWSYFEPSKKQRQAILAFKLINKVENTKNTEFIWNESLMIENGLKQVSKMGFVVNYKFSNGWDNKNRIYFYFSKS